MFSLLKSTKSTQGTTKGEISWESGEFWSKKLTFHAS